MRAWALVVFAACAHTAHPAVDARAPVRAEIERAEDAEKARQHDQAEDHYKRAIALATAPRDAAWAEHEFAETLATWGRLDDAAHQLEAATHATPNDPSLWQDLGIVRHKLGDDPGALAALGQAKDLAPADARPRVALAALEWSLGRRTEALAEYRALLALDLPDRLREKVRWAIDVLSRPPAPPPGS